MPSKFDSLTDDEILFAYNSSESIIEFIKKIGCSKTSLRTNKHITNRIESLNLDISNLRKIKSATIRTKGDAFEQYKNWQTARSFIRDQARKNYEKSDKPKQCIICGYPYYEVAHIKAVGDFDNKTPLTVINDISNLAALCPNHHYEYDTGLLEIDF